MKQRNPLAVVLFTIITFGIYGIVWSVKTKNEMNARGASIPTAWLIIVPFVNIWWLWKYSEGVEKVTGGKTSTILAFVLQFLLGVIGMAIIQYEFNKVDTEAVAAPLVPEATTDAAPGFGAPETPAVAESTPAAAAATTETPIVAPSAPEVSTAEPTTATPPTPEAPETTVASAAPEATVSPEATPPTEASTTPESTESTEESKQV